MPRELRRRQADPARRRRGGRRSAKQIQAPPSADAHRAGGTGSLPASDRVHAAPAQATIARTSSMATGFGPCWIWLHSCQSPASALPTRSLLNPRSRIPPRLPAQLRRYPDHANPQIVRITHCSPLRLEKATESYSRRERNPLDSQKVETVLSNQNTTYSVGQAERMSYVSARISVGWLWGY